MSQPYQSGNHLTSHDPAWAGDVAQNLLRRWGFDAGNETTLPTRHPEYRDCEHHGRFAISQVDTQGVVRYIPPLCPVCTAERVSRRLLDSASIPARYRTCDFVNYLAETPAQKAALRICREYAEHFEQNAAEGRGLILQGNHGTGKNHLAAAIARKVLSLGRTVLFATVREIVSRIRETWSGDAGPSEREIIRGFAEVDLLILDEVGRQYGTDSERIHLFEIIDRRYREMRPTIVLSNETPAGIEACLGRAAYDRLCHHVTLVQFPWSSYRRGRPS